MMFDVAPEPPGLGGSRQGPPGPEAQVVALGLLLIGVVAALAYGLVFLRRPASTLKTLVKTAAVGALAAGSLLLGLPVLLVVGLVLSAVGDAFLAGDGKRWLPYGLAAFLAAHLAYIALFAAALGVGRGGLGGFDVSLTAPRAGGMVVSLIAAIAMLRWLWSALGALRWAVVAYVAAILGMVWFSLLLPDRMLLATAGAFCFFASDAILSAQLFRQRWDNLAGRWAVWALYFLAQALIVLGSG